MDAVCHYTINAVWRYVRDDLSARYGLKEKARIVVSGKGVCIGNAQVGPLTIKSWPDAGTVTLEAEPFEASTGYWNGPNVVPDDLKDGSLEASLWHDLIWHFCGDIARQTGKSAGQVLEWSNGILAAAWQVLEWSNGILSAAWRFYGRELYGRSEGSGRRRGWLAYQVCRFGAWFKKFFVRISCMAFAAGLLAGCNGCANPPEWDVVDSSGELMIAHGVSAPAAGPGDQPPGAIFEKTERMESGIDG